jgi:hypothetical protein
MWPSTARLQIDDILQFLHGQFVNVFFGYGGNGAGQIGFDDGTLRDDTISSPAIVSSASSAFRVVVVLVVTRTFSTTTVEYRQN